MRVVAISGMKRGTMAKIDEQRLENIYGFDWSKPWDGSWFEREMTPAEILETLKSDHAYWAEMEQGWRNPERIAECHDPEHRLIRNQQALAFRRAKMFEAAILAVKKREEHAGQLVRANKIIGWMSEYIGKMCPPPNGLHELNQFWLYIQKEFPHLVKDGSKT